MYDHYIAIDWAQENMAVARLTSKLDKVKVFEGPADVGGLKEYFKGLSGKIVLTLEESTASQWLYTELKNHVDQLIVCDPYRNRLLSEGAKNDKIDATKLVKLLRSGLLKEVYHSGEAFIHLRKIVSGYEDLIRSGVSLKNQRSSMFRALGLRHKNDTFPSDLEADQFVLKRLEERIKEYEKQKEEYEEEFHRLSKKYKAISNLKSISGIGDIHAVQIAATVVDAHRFPTDGHFLSYCGLIKHDRQSGGKSYGKKLPRYNRLLKRVFKMATFTVIQEGRNNPFCEYYEELVKEKKLPVHVAQHAIARRMAILTYGVLKSNKKFDLDLCRGNDKKVLVRS
jgi:transposase